MFTLSQICVRAHRRAARNRGRERPSLRDYLPQLAGILRSDAAFSRVALVRLLAGLGSLASSFYVLHATQVLGAAASLNWPVSPARPPWARPWPALACWASSPTAMGSHRVMQITTWSQVLVPLLALLFHFGVFGGQRPLITRCCSSCWGCSMAAC